MTNDPTMLVKMGETIPWEPLVNPVTGKTFHPKTLIADPDTGMEVFIVRYPAGVHTPAHTHNCAHGLFVIEGTLVTHDGTFTEGDFVWYEEGVVGEHGATDATSVTLLFTTNKPFDITFVDR